MDRQHALVLAEKPDLARKIMQVYRDHEGELAYTCEFAAQRGHLVTLMMPDEVEESMKSPWTWDQIPYDPEEHGGWKTKVIEDSVVPGSHFKTSQDRYNIIKKELKSGKYDFVIHAGDPDQEGELLVRLVLEKAGNTLPVRRFWTNDLTESHILNALKNLLDDDTDPMLNNLLNAAYARQHSDYRFGINISRAATLQMGGQVRVSCGRVETPILAIVCRREQEIRDFKPKTVYGVKVRYQEGFTGTLFDESAKSDSETDEDAKQGIVWFDTEKEAEDLIRTLPKKGTVLSYTTKRKETYAPKLFKLATLQIEAGKIGISDKTTLDALQALYEAGYLSYPRTDCEYLSSAEDFTGILRSLWPDPAFTPYLAGLTPDKINSVRTKKRWINDKALQESGHSALRPTTKVPDRTTLTDVQNTIYDLVCKRFIAIFLPPQLTDQTRMVADFGGSTFLSTGKTQIDPGYTVIFGTKAQDTKIPPHKKGDILTADRFEPSEKTSVCPKRFTSPDLIAVCENPAKYLDDKALKALGKRLKIGTPATRSGIIRKLIDTYRYMEEKQDGKRKSVIFPTETGEAIIHNLFGFDICKVDMTGYWEEELELVRTGKKKLEDVEKEMKDSVAKMVAEIKDTPMEPLARGGGSASIVCKCPECGGNILSGAKGFYCSNYKTLECKAGAYRIIAGSRVTDKEFAKMMAGEKVKKKLKTKTGKTWEQELEYDSSEHKIIFVKAAVTATSHECPFCHTMMEKSGDALRCPGKNADGTDCGFRLYTNVSKHVLSDEDIDKLLAGQKAGPFFDFWSDKKKKKFAASLVFDKDTKRIKFDFS